MRKPVGKWIEGYGEEAKGIIDANIERLEAKFGEERAHRIAKKNRNIWIFPNLIINDIMAITIRTFYPTAPGYIEVTGYALAAAEENENFRQVRNDSFLEFYGQAVLLHLMTMRLLSYVKKVSKIVKKLDGMIFQEV